MSTSSSPEYREQPDGRMVAGPELPDWSKEKKSPNYAAGALVLVTLGICAAAFFMAGRASIPTAESVPFADQVVAQRIRVAEPCGDLTHSEFAVIPLNKPLTGSDITYIKSQLALGGYQNVTVKNVKYRGNFYYFAMGCRP